MWSWRRVLAILLVTCLIALLILPQGVKATVILKAEGAGWVGGAVFNLTREGRLSLDVNGTAPFDLYVVTYENLKKLVNGSQFGYIDSLSKMNVTTAGIDGALPAGSYAYWLYAYSPGNFTFITTSITYPSSETNPWAWIAVIGAVVISTALLTFIISRHKYRKMQ